MNIPLLTTPLTKAIRTSEGIMVYLVNFVLGFGAAVDPSSLPPGVAAKWAAVVTVGHVLSRTLLKVFAAQKSFGVGPPDDAGQLKP